jgi:hypothetical protein
MNRHERRAREKMERKGNLKVAESEVSMIDQIRGLVAQMRQANMQASETYMVLTEQSKAKQAELDALNGRIDSTLKGRIMVEGKIAAYEDIIRAMTPNGDQAPIPEKDNGNGSPDETGTPEPQP